MTTLIPKFDLKNGGSTPANAVNRDINLKLAEVVSIEDFGASPSANAADNAIAIQAAIDSFGTGGGSVYIPNGTYLYDTTIDLGQSIELIGESQNGTILTYTGTANGIQTSEPCFYPKIRNFTLLCNNASNIGIGIQWGNYERHGVIENMLIRYFGLKGIEIRGGLDNIIRHCNVFNNDANKAVVSVGIHIRPNAAGVASTTTTIEKCYVSSQQNTAGNSIAIRWDNAYMCYDTDNITESSDIGRVVSTDYSLSSENSRISIFNPYYEAVTTELEWYDSYGYYVQGNGTIDPNTIASWNTVPAGFQYIWYQNNPTNSGNNFSQIGSTKINGVAKAIGLATSTAIKGDANYTYDPYGTQVNIFAPTTAKTVTLPTAVGIAGWYTTVVKSNNTNTQTIVPNGSQTISGQSSYVLNYTGEHVTLVSDGANWQVIGSGGIKQPAIADGSTVNDVLAALRAYGVIAP